MMTTVGWARGLSLGPACVTRAVRRDHSIVPNDSLIIDEVTRDLAEQSLSGDPEWRPRP